MSAPKIFHKIIGNIVRINSISERELPEKNCFTYLGNSSSEEKLRKEQEVANTPLPENKGKGRYADEYENRKLSDTDIQEYTNDGKTTAEVIFGRGLVGMNDEDSSRNIMEIHGFDIKNLPEDAITKDKNGITYKINKEYYRVAVDNEGKANIIRSMPRGNKIISEIYQTKIYADNGQTSPTGTLDLSADNGQTGQSEPLNYTSPLNNPNGSATNSTFTLNNPNDSKKPVSTDENKGEQIELTEKNKKTIDNLVSVGWDKNDATKIIIEHKKNLQKLKESKSEMQEDEYWKKFEEILDELDKKRLGPNQDINDLNSRIGDSRQGNNGDCLILAQLKGLSSTVFGYDAFNETIKPDGLGGATITFKGAESSNNTFKISKSEIDEAQEKKWAATGDKDVAAMELALKKYIGLKPSDDLSAEILKNKKNISFPQLLLGDNVEVITLKNGAGFINRKDYVNTYNYNSSYDFVKQQFNNKSSSITCSFKSDVLTQNIYTQHAYNIANVTEEDGKEYITVINPWNTNEPIKMTREEFEKNIDLLQCTSGI